MKKPIFTGSGVAIITPFTKDGVDYDKLGELIDFHVNNSTDAIVICGTTGEASTMPDSEHKAAIKFAVEKTARRIPVIAGTGSNDTHHAADLSVYSQKVGADGILLVTPYYNKTSQRGLVMHFEHVAKLIEIPVILYNIPGRTGIGISIEAFCELSKTSNINGVKDASGDLALVAKVAANTDLNIYSGNDDIIVPVMSLGGKGVISVVANILPKETHDICQKYLDGDYKGSKELFLSMLNLINSLFIDVNPIPIKMAMNMLDYNVGPLRMPLCDMSSANVDVLKKALVGYGLKV